MKITDDRELDGVRERDFLLEDWIRPVPGVLWTPRQTSSIDKPLDGDAPLVLVGHGASGHCHQDYVVALGRGLAADFHIAAAAIDGPVHGARREDGGMDGRRVFLDFAAAWSSDTSLTDHMVDDWRATLDSLLDLEEIGGPVGYWGLSMGTILGLPFVAADERVSACVLGLMGLTGPTAARIALDAPRVRCPALFLVQWSDELFARELAFELFEALGSGDKTLHANPGNHGGVPSEELAVSARYLARRLRGRAIV